MWLTSKNEQGITLVEVLATLVISAIIITFVGSLFVKAINSFERTSGEAALRDEADVMMARLTNDLFTLKASDIEGTEVCPAAGVTCTTGSWIKLKNGQRIGFINKILYTRSGTYTVNTKNVELQTNYQICTGLDSTTCNLADTTIPKSFFVQFTLKNTKKNTSVTSFKNEVPIVYDKKE